jgi:hypothetical protein
MHRRIIREYQPQYRVEIKPKEYHNPMPIHVHKLYNVKSYKNPTVLYKPSGRNISLPPINGWFRYYFWTNNS